MFRLITFTFFFAMLLAFSVNAQQRVIDSDAKKQPEQTVKKANARPAENSSKAQASEPFDKATTEKMSQHCVRLETEIGTIELAMLPTEAPETVRNFLNLVAIGAFDTTTFSRVVPDFIVQGGNLSTREKMTPALEKRASRTIADEPKAIKHERGVVSMARPDTPNGASTHFFILVGDARHLDGTFSAFGRVIGGMEFVDSMNKMPVNGDKPEKPVRLKRASLFQCT